MGGAKAEGGVGGGVGARDWGAASGRWASAVASSAASSAAIVYAAGRRKMPLVGRCSAPCSAI